MYTHFFLRGRAPSLKKNLLDSFTSFCSFSLFNFQGPARHLLGDSFLIISHTFPFVNNFFILFTKFFQTSLYVLPPSLGQLIYYTTLSQFVNYFFIFFVFFLFLCVRSLERSCIIYLPSSFVNYFFLFMTLYTKRGILHPLFMHIMMFLHIIFFYFLYEHSSFYHQDKKTYYYSIDLSA